MSSIFFGALFTLWRARNSSGVMPVDRLNARKNVTLVPKPARSAMLSIGNALDARSSSARRMRAFSKYADTVTPASTPKARLRARGDMACSRANSLTCGRVPVAKHLPR